VPNGLSCLVVKSRPTSVVCAALAGLVIVVGSSAHGQTPNPVSMIDNTTTTPVPGVPHDYIQSLNETVNPANGALSVRIKAPTPQERGVNWPLYVFMYDSNQQYQLWPTWSPFSTGGVTGQNLNSLNYAAPLPPTLNGQTSTQSSTLPSGNGTNTTYYCNVTSGYMLTDPDGGLHGLGMTVTTPTYTVPPNQGSSCGSIPQINVFAGGDIQYKAYIHNPTTAPNTVEVVDTHGDAVATGVNITGNVAVGAEDVNGNETTATASSTGRTFSTSGQSGPGDTTTMTLPGVSGDYQQIWAASTTPSFTLSFVPVSGTVCNGSITSITAGGTNPIVPVSRVSTVTLPDGLSYVFTYDSVYGLINKITFPTGAWVEYTWGINQAAESNAWPVVGNNPNQCELIHDWFAITKRVVSHDGTNADEEQDFSYSTTWPGGSSNPTSTFWTNKTTTVTTKDLLRGTSSQTIYTYSPMLAPPSQPLQGASVRGDIPVENTITYKDTSGALLKTVTKTWQSMSLMSAECETLPNGQMSGKFYTYQPYTGFSRLGITPLNPEANWTDLPTDVAEYDYGKVTSCVNPTSTIPSPTAIRETVTTYSNSFLSVASPLFPYVPPSSSTPSSSILLDRPSSVQVFGNGTLLSQTNYSYDGATPSGVTGASTTPNPPPSPPNNPPNSPPNCTVTGFDCLQYGSGTTPPRGNLTLIQKCTAISGNACSTFGVVSSFTYDLTGQVITATAPCGNAACSDMSSGSQTTTYSYIDGYVDGAPPSGYVTNAYPTKIIAPQTGSITHTTTYQFGYTDGKLWQATDFENNITTKYCYFTGGFSGSSCNGSADPYYRLTGVLHPDNGQETIAYFDGSVSESPTVNTSTLLSTGLSVTKESIYDAFGLETTSLLTSDQDGTDEVDTTYDGLGQVWTKTNPYRPSVNSPTNGTSTFYYDALGRKVKGQEPDGTTLQTCYDNITSVPAVANCSSHVGTVTTGNWVDSSDESGNHWQRTSNALGQLMDVIEPNGSSQSPSMETDYTYDANSNLLSVKQCGALCSNPVANAPATRTFIYDPLSRLTSAFNPETGTVSYTYDANSNVSTKTDARGVVTSHLYDVLNRLHSKTYTNDPANTLSSCYQYDSAVNGIGKLGAEWTYSGTCATTAPSSGYQSERVLGAYDPMGRLWTEKQCVLGFCTSASPPSPPQGSCSSLSSANGLSYCYDLAGNLTAYSNGLTLTAFPKQAILFSQGVDNAGRLAWIGSSLTGPQLPPCLFNAQSNSTSTACSQLPTQPAYATFGALQNWILGSNLDVNKGYNSRLLVTGQTATQP